MLILVSVCCHEERQPSKEISNFATSQLGVGLEDMESKGPD
jgi:hypothetical protein